MDFGVRPKYKLVNKYQLRLSYTAECDRGAEDTTMSKADTTCSHSLTVLSLNNVSSGGKDVRLESSFCTQEEVT